MTTWIFVAALLTATGAPDTYHSPSYPTEDACDTARNAWLREQVGPITIVDLGECKPVPVREPVPMSTPRR